jgi:RNA polymerase sigma-70 factor (ECF subfamily)
MKPITNARQSSGAFARSKLLLSRKNSLLNRRSAASRRTTHSAALIGKPVRILDETIRLAQQGDAAAFEALYQLHSRRVYSLCLRMIGDPVEAEDLTQEAFMQLFRKIHTFRGESAFSSWLHRLTANIVLMRFRKKTPPITSLDELVRDDDESNRPKFEIGIRDLRLAGVVDRLNLEGVLEQLPEGYKLMFILHDVHGYEHNEIAAILGCSVGNSKSQLHKARKRLRELLQRASTNSNVHTPATKNVEARETIQKSSAVTTYEALRSPDFALSPAL